MTETAQKQQASVNKASSGTNRRALRKMKAMVLPLDKSFDKTPPQDLVEKVAGETGESKRLPDDPFLSLLGKGQILTPPFDLLTLTMLPEHSTELNQCIEAMEINIEGYGHRFVPRIDPDSEETPEDVAKQVRAERVRLENFFTYANFEDSFIKMRRKMRRDLETAGNAYWEVLRGANGEVQGFEPIPAYQVRLSKIDSESTDVQVPILRLHVDGSVEVDKIPRKRRFRKYVQTRLVANALGSRTSDHRLAYFKEFGDPRVIDNQTGKVVPPERVNSFDKEGNPMPESRKANELAHWKIFSARSPYGIPRYIGNLLSIFGDRKAEEINFITFENNCVPSMMILVSNGQLTQGSIDRIEDFVESQIRGSDNYSKFLIVEAEGEDQDGEDSAVSKIHVEKMRDQQHEDALFQNYSSNNQDKIRRAFRLPPILVGRSEQYNRATAETSRKLADEQVFAPERLEFDSWVNRCLFPEMGIVFHTFKSNSPNTTDNLDLVKILGSAEKTGGMTPRIARWLLMDILGDQELPEFPPDFEADVPFSLTMAEAVKNMADASEPGQQVTALKNMIETLVEEHLESKIEEELEKRAEEESNGRPEKGSNRS